MKRKPPGSNLQNAALLWGGRFRSAPTAPFRRFNDSFSFDWELLNEDIEGSLAWTEVLRQAGVLSKAEAEKMKRALSELSHEFATNRPKKGSYEDVHTFVEAMLAQKIGPLAGKLHTGRSRNDQVATDLKLYLKKALVSARKLTLESALALAERAWEEASTAMPGYTHLKQAEPVTFGHWCLAYVEMLLRDAERLANAVQRADECPLGSGALAGTPLKIDRVGLARALGFARPSVNSLDAVSDRDVAAEFLFAGALLLVHLSRLAEDVILFSSDEFGFLELPDELATGSSRMPHKKNPDFPELVRGHAARSLGDLIGLLALLKGLPLAYNKDLQLDKEPVFRLHHTLESALPLLAELVKTLKLDRKRMHTAASGENFAATSMADLLAARGIPFREAHRRIGRRLADEKEGKGAAALHEFAGPANNSGRKIISVESVLAQKQTLGGTAPARVKSAAAAALKQIRQLQRKN